MYKIYKVSQLVGSRVAIAVAYNLTKDQAQAIIRNATDKDFYDYYIAREY